MRSLYWAVMTFSMLVVAVKCKYLAGGQERLLFLFLSVLRVSFRQS